MWEQMLCNEPSVLPLSTFLLNLFSNRLPTSNPDVHHVETRRERRREMKNKKKKKEKKEVVLELGKLRNSASEPSDVEVRHWLPQYSSLM